MAFLEGRYYKGSMTDKRYEADGLAEYCRRFLSSGVWEFGSNLEVKPYGAMYVSVGYGAAMVDGYLFKVTEDGVNTLTLKLDNAENLPRIDRIVLRKDSVSKNIDINIKKGAAASSPVPPALERSDAVYEISLARILVPAGAAEIVMAYITDERTDTAMCGIVSSKIGLAGPSISALDNISVFNSTDGNKLKDSGISIRNIWHKGNDGAGSGLDADQLDGYHESSFIKTSASCNKNWNWSGQGGQPSWLWGGNDGTNMYVYNPSNFSVNYANSSNYSNSSGSAGYANSSGIANSPSFGQGSCINISGQDCLANKNTGFYMGSGCPNAPSGDWYYFIWLRHNDIWNIIIAFPLNIAGLPRWRRQANGGWGNWYDLVH